MLRGRHSWPHSTQQILGQGQKYNNLAPSKNGNYITPVHSAPQKSPHPLETMSQFAKPVIPDESAYGG
ncbi:MAG: hypothetical protein C0610_16160 [Desulfobacteraceae bacterium]|nr:MAG: hypothetical protein C0610_16160 [Desulfobacteraceae bacterium]